MARLLSGPMRGTLGGQLHQLAAQVVRQPDAMAALAVVQGSVADLVREQGARTEAKAPAVAAAGPATTDAGTNRVEGPGERSAPAGFRVEVEGALRRLNDLPALSHHPLLEDLAPTTAVDDGATHAGGVREGMGKAPTPLERAAQLRDALVQAVGRLRPPGARPNPG